MLELLMRKIRQVVKAQDEFCAARSAQPDAADSEQRIPQVRDPARRCGRLHARMRRRTVRAAVADAPGPLPIQG